MMHRPLIFLLWLAASAVLGVDPYWVSPSGAAGSWAAAQSATPLSGAACASLATFEAASEAAGDTIYFRDGVYTRNSSSSFLVPAVSGTAASNITFAAWTGESPIITNINAGTGFYAVSLNAKDYIVIDGISFVDFPRHVIIQNGSDNNIVRNCEISRTVVSTLAMVPRGIQIRGNATGSTNNWILNNTIHGLYLDPCGEGGDGIMLGDTGTDFDSNYNTIESNTIYNIGHTGTENFTQYNVWRGNYVHNEGFKTVTANLTGTATGGSTTTLIDTSKDFSALGVLTGTFLYLHNLSDPGSGDADHALINSISTTTNPNDTLNFSAGGGSPTFSAGNTYSIGCLYFVDAAAPGNGKYGHRAYELDSKSAQRGTTFEDNQLFEGNRAGHAASNPGNDGPDGLSLSSGRSIIRHNAFFGCAGPGIYFKNGAVASSNRVYNNTIYFNGRFAATQSSDNPVTLTGIQLTSASSNNVMKNNIIYGNVGGDFNGAIPADWTVTNNHLAADGNPLFVDTDLTAPTNAALPNLNLQASSSALDAGSFLTMANGAGTNSSTLVVDDSLYFQDGTWGSSLSSVSADHVALSTVANTVQISAINYATHTLTLASAKTWTNNAPVWLYKDSAGVVVLSGSAPDMGAHESAGFWFTTWDPATQGMRIKAQ